MIALVVVVFDEAPDLRFEIARQVIVLQQYPVLERLMPTLDLALGLGVIGSSQDDLQPVCELEPPWRVQQDTL